MKTENGNRKSENSVNSDDSDYSETTSLFVPLRQGDERSGGGMPNHPVSLFPFPLPVQTSFPFSDFTFPFKMKHIIILGDGMADWHNEALGGKTLLQHAHTPNADRLARMGRCGLLRTVADGFHPGSEVANSSILGYDQHVVYEGRGPL